MKRILPWLPWVAAIGAVWAVVWLLNSRAELASTLAREREASRLAAEGFAVAEEVSARRLADLIVTSQVLAEEVARLQAASPGAKPTGHFSGTTGPQPLSPVASPGMATTPLAVAGASPGTSCPPCLLTAWDTLELRFRVATLETRAGNIVAVGAGEAYRGDGHRLVSAPLRLEVGVVERPKEKDWGAGVLALAGREGWALGPAASPPALHVLGLDLELVVGVAAGPNGYWSSAAAGIVRW